MGNGNPVIGKRLARLGDLLTPHGEREQFQPSCWMPSVSSPNPSWGTGTWLTRKRRATNSFPPNPSWGTGTVDAASQNKAEDVS